MPVFQWKSLAFSAALALASLTTLGHAQQQPTASEAREQIENRIMARLKLASEYYSRNQIGAALRELMSAQDISSDYAPLQSMLGIVNMDLHRYDEAEKAFQKALKMERNDPDIHNNYGWFLCVSGQHAKGLEWLTRAWNNPLYGTPEKALYNAGRCARMANDQVRAVEFFAKALQLSPNSTAIMYELANMQFDQGNYTKVLEVIDRIHGVEKASPQSLWLALRAENRLSHGVEVESYGSQLQRKFPNSAEATLWLTRNIN
jgi:type IV pilus assembly protein PilF